MGRSTQPRALPTCWLVTQSKTCSPAGQTCKTRFEFPRTPATGKAGYTSGSWRGVFKQVSCFTLQFWPLGNIPRAHLELCPTMGVVPLDPRVSQGPRQRHPLTWLLLCRLVPSLSLSPILMDMLSSLDWQAAPIVSRDTLYLFTLWIATLSWPLACLMVI